MHLSCKQDNTVRFRNVAHNVNNLLKGGTIWIKQLRVLILCNGVISLIGCIDLWMELI